MQQNIQFLQVSLPVVFLFIKCTIISYLFFHTRYFHKERERENPPLIRTATIHIKRDFQTQGRVSPSQPWLHIYPDWRFISWTASSACLASAFGRCRTRGSLGVAPALPQLVQGAALLTAALQQQLDGRETFMDTSGDCFVLKAPCDFDLVCIYSFFCIDDLHG